MRHLILNSIFAAALLIGAGAAWQASAAPLGKGTAPAVAAQTEPVRCYWNAPRDGCGIGWYRTRRGNCRPC